MPCGKTASYIDGIISGAGEKTGKERELRDESYWQTISDKKARKQIVGMPRLPF